MFKLKLKPKERILEGLHLANQKSYYFPESDMDEISKKYPGSVFMGSWCIKGRTKSWVDKPVDVFYQPNPDIELGHSHYFGLFVGSVDKVIICNAKSAFSETIMGILEDNTVYVSRWRHNYVLTKHGAAIDGGRDYTKITGSPLLINIKVDKDKFIFTLNEVNTFMDYVRYYFRKIIAWW